MPLAELEPRSSRIDRYIYQRAFNISSIKTTSDTGTIQPHKHDPHMRVAGTAAAFGIRTSLEQRKNITEQAEPAAAMLK